ncbi:transferase [Lipomyces kononenkoae]|uniref:Transferase n=1 Tax=Lipomyces kononenkoae TaxID=34357 RepID=A0ACC3T409_LIPKO
MQLSTKTYTLTDFHLDILGQQPRINRLYTQITLCFQLPGPYAQSEIVSILKSGFDSLSENFPWIAGKIGNEDDTFKIKPSVSENKSHIVVRDYTNDDSVPDWNALRKANFPFSMIDEPIFAPCKTVEPDSEGLLVFIIQANFVNGGGLLLTLNGQHGSMDMAGQSQMMYLLAKACRNEPFTDMELAIGNMDRQHILSLLHDPDTLDSYKPKEEGKQRQAETTSPSSCTWTYFSFSATDLASMKSEATSTIPSSGTCGFVSTDDVLSAFIWQSISRSRLPRYSTKPSASAAFMMTTLSRNVDVRRYLNIPPTYPGLVTNATVHTSSLNDVVEQSIGVLSSQLRTALDPISLSHRTRELATLLSKEKNAQNATIVPKGVPELDVRLSSWAKEKCYCLDFGFGLPAAVRRPRFTDGAREGLVYFLPKRLDGQIVVGICLREEDMERLKGDEQFVRFGRYIG